MRFTVAEALAALAEVPSLEPVWVEGEATEASESSPKFEGAAIDSRAIRGGEAFFAFVGEKTDGHLHVHDAFSRGAAMAFVERWPLPHAPFGRPIVRVSTTFGALQALAAHARRTVPEKLVAITGSAGKTTTKDLLAAMLAKRFTTAATQGNFNNQIGFPISLLNVPDGTEWMVAELGMSSAGELSALSRLARPDVAVFTVVRAAHLEFFASVSDIAEAKSEILAGLASNADGGVIVANADDPEVVRIARRHQAAHGHRVVWYGHREGAQSADVRAVDLSAAPGGEIGTRFRLEVGLTATVSVDVRLALHGRYNVDNFLAAAAAAWAVGVPLDEIAAVGREIRPAGKRGVVRRLSPGYTLIDDTYNANPDATAQALASAAELPASRHVAILGEMRELGPLGGRFHHETGALAVAHGFSVVAGVGALARELVAAAQAAGAEAAWFPDATAAAEWAVVNVRAGDVVLVKGSRGVRLESVVERLIGAAGATGDGASFGGAA